MNDSKKSERIVVDESVFENLFGTEAGKPTPEEVAETDAKSPPEVPAPVTPPEAAIENRRGAETPAAASAPAPEQIVESGGGESVYDSRSVLSRALMLDGESAPTPQVVAPKPVRTRGAKQTQTTESRPAAPSRPATGPKPAPEGRADDPVWQHAQGNRQFSHGDYSGAEESYRKVLKIDPDSWSAHFNLGIVLEQLTRDEEALAEYGVARRIDGNRIEAVVRSGFIQLRLHKYEDALATFKFVLAAETRNGGAQFGKGCALQYLEMFGEANECYKTLLEDHPKSEELLGNLAVTSLELKDYSHASECAEMIPETSEEPAYRLRLRIGCAVAQGDEETAAQYSAQLVEMVEGSYEAWFNLGVACQRTGRLEVAVDAYKQALAVEPDRPEAQVNLGAVLHESENLVEARQFYEAALRSGPANNHPGVNWNLGLAAESLGAFDDAEKAYGITVRCQPEWKEAVGRLTRLNPARGAAH